MDKKIWPWFGFGVGSGAFLGWAVARVWAEPLLFWSLLENDFGFLLILTAIVLGFFGSLAPFGLVLVPRSIMLGQSLLIGFASLLIMIYFGMPVWVSGLVAGVLVVISLVFSRRVMNRTRRLVGLYLGEILSSAVRSGLGVLILLLPVVGYASIQLQPGRDQPIFPPVLVRQVLRPAVKVLNRQLADQLQAVYGDRFVQAIGTRDREEILKFVKAELIESTQEGQVRQVFGLTAANLNLEKIEVSPEGEIDLWPAVEASLPKLTKEASEMMFGYRWLIELVLVFSQTLVLGTWVWLASPLITWLLAKLIEVLVGLGYFHRKEETVQVTRLSLTR